MTASPADGTPPGDANDVRRDILAMIAGRLAGDDDGVMAVWRSCNKAAVLPFALGMIVDLLQDQGIEPAAWVQAKQAELAGAPPEWIE